MRLDPITAQNPPFLSHIAYRTDDYSALRYKMLQRMQERFPRWNVNLAEKQGAQDFAVALIELFSCLGDILGFYQDCRANEAFLRTALLPASLIEICSLIDYKIPPGASASTLQVFFLKDGQSGLIPSGFQIKTGTISGQPTLVFETDQNLQATAARNTLHLSGYDRSARVLSATGQLPETSILLDQGYAGLKANSFVVFAGANNLIPIRLTAVTDEGAQRRIGWQVGALPSGRNLPIADLLIYGNPTQEMKLAAAAKANEISVGQYSAAVSQPAKLEQHDRVLFVSQNLQLPAIIISKSGSVVTWNRAFPIALQRAQTTIYSAGAHQFAWANAVKVGATELEVHTVSQGASAAPGDLVLLGRHGTVELARIASVSSGSYQLVDPVSRAYPNGVGLYAVSLPDPDTGQGGSPNTALAPLRLDPSLTEIELDKSYDRLTPGSVVVISDGEYQEAYWLAAVAINSAGNTVLTLSRKLSVDFKIATAVVYGPFQNSMRVAGYNRAESTTAIGLSKIVLSGTVSAFKPGEYIVISDGTNAEGVRISDVAIEGGNTSLDLESALLNSYGLADAQVYGNVAPVTHGRTVTENSLGSGDQSQSNQTFTLHQSPTTFVHDPLGGRGIANTLQVFVGDERWMEVESLADSGPDDHVYSTSIDQNGLMSFTTGDGRHGAKLPTGTNNISVIYRIGLGSNGNVDANAITVMPAPLPFLQSTQNLIAAAGGADAESSDRTRASAPVTIRTLDRGVSVSDYSDLALSFAGIAKARADLQRFGGQPVLQLTVASVGGRPLTLPLRAALSAFLEDRRSPHVQLLIQDFQPVPIHLSLEVHILPSFLQTGVKLQLFDVFGSGTTSGGRSGYFNFDRQQLGQSLYLSDIYALVETVPGVDYLIVREFRPEARADLTGQAQDIIPLAANAVATGGDSENPLRGILSIQAIGGIA
jgi:Baseplate J-like protein